MKIRNILIVAFILCIAAGRVAVAGDISSADKLREQATVLYKNGHADKALVVLQQAKKEYQGLLQENPDNKDAIRGMAMTLFDLGEYQKADSLFKKAGIDVKVKNFDTLEIVSNKTENINLTNSVTRSENSVSNKIVSTPSANSKTGVVIAAAMETSMTNSVVENNRKQVTDSAIKLVPTPDVIRGIEVQPNLIYSDMPEIMMQNIRDFVKRASAMHANSVFIDAFARVDANGSYRAAYFENSVMPVRADILRPLSEELAKNNIAVFAVMPVLSFYLKENSHNNSMLVMSRQGDDIIPSKSWRRRISPFNTNGIVMVNQIYSELAENVPLNGIVFGDDAYLTDTEDLNPAALAVYSNRLGLTDIVLSRLTPQQRMDIAKIRTEQLEVFCGSLILTVREKQPDIKFINTLYATAITYPPSEGWLAQNYKDSLLLYDKVMVLADPELEYTKRHSAWFRQLRDSVITVPGGADKTIFRLATYSTMEKAWISERTQLRLIKMLSKSGINNFVLAPDDFRNNRPRLKKIKRVFP